MNLRLRPHGESISEETIENHLTDINQEFAEENIEIDRQPSFIAAGCANEATYTAASNTIAILATNPQLLVHAYNYLTHHFNLSIAGVDGLSEKPALIMAIEDNQLVDIDLEVNIQIDTSQRFVIPADEEAWQTLSDLETQPASEAESQKPTEHSED